MVGEAPPARPAIVGRDIAGPLVQGRPKQVASFWFAVPALLLITVVLAVPILLTISSALDDRRGGAGLGNFVAIFSDPDAVRALVNTFWWAVIALGVAVLALAVAMLGRRVRRPPVVLLVALIAPVGVSALVAGVAFRLVFDPTPQRGILSALVVAVPGAVAPGWLAPNLVWLVLVSAFAWSWLGFAVALFRRALGEISPDLERMARSHRVGWLTRQRTVVLPLLLPIMAVVVLTLVIAALRLFDLVLVVVPFSVQDEVNVVSVYWWRNRGDGRASAMASLLFVVVALVALACGRGLRPRHGVTRRHDDQRPRSLAQWLGLGAAVMLALGWLLPLAVLLVTSVRSPRDAAITGWWTAATGGLSGASFQQAAGTGLWSAVLSTSLLAVFATALVLVGGVPAAYWLACAHMPEWLRRSLVVALAVLAVAPISMYAGPLARVFTTLGLGGQRWPLIIVHVAAGLPFAVLLLRAAFDAAPGRISGAVRAGQLGQRPALVAMSRHSSNSLVAVGVLEFVQVWNDFAVGLLISGPGAVPLGLVLWGEARQFGTSAGPVAAGAVIAALVPVTVLLVYWRRVIGGLTRVTEPAAKGGTR